jgi:hypothetical protein
MHDRVLAVDLDSIPDFERLLAAEVPVAITSSPPRSS